MSGRCPGAYTRASTPPPQPFFPHSTQWQPARFVWTSQKIFTPAEDELLAMGILRCVGGYFTLGTNI